MTLDEAFNTEAQQVALELVRYYIRAAIIALHDQIEELNKKPITSELKDNIDMALLRMDLLGKVDLYLLNNLIEHYKFVMRAKMDMESGDIKLLIDETEKGFIKRVMQGLV